MAKEWYDELGSKEAAYKLGIRSQKQAKKFAECRERGEVYRPRTSTHKKVLRAVSARRLAEQEARGRNPVDSRTTTDLYVRDRFARSGATISPEYRIPTIDDKEAIVRARVAALDMYGEYGPSMLATGSLPSLAPPQVDVAPNWTQKDSREADRRDGNFGIVVIVLAVCLTVFVGIASYVKITNKHEMAQLFVDYLGTNGINAELTTDKNGYIQVLIERDGVISSVYFDQILNNAISPTIAAIAETRDGL